MTQKIPPHQMRKQIDENLKKVFQEQTEEELPDRFKQLLDQLRAQDSTEKSDTQDDD